MLPIVQDAISRDRKLAIRYWRAEPGREERSCVERVVDPLGLVAKGSTWYLVAQVEEATRTYRVSRIREAAALDRPAARPPDFDLAAYWERSAAEFREKLPRYYATYLVNPAVMKWARYRGWRLEEETPEGDRIRIRLRFDIEEEAIQFALSFGGAVEAIEPAGLMEKVLAGARAILDCARDAG
jgi:predicted DNA-binding transcriptional regulator YafY